MMLSRGFTLIELMVAMSIFSITMLLVAGTYLISLGNARQMQDVSNANEELAVALDDMVRDIRTGSCASGQCATAGGVSSSSFTFTNTNGCTVTYSVDASGQLERQVAATTGCSAATEVLTNIATVTLQSLTFDTYRLAETNAGVTGQQLWTTILVTGTALPGTSNAHTFHIETGATMRSISIL